MEIELRLYVVALHFCLGVGNHLFASATSSPHQLVILHLLPEEHQRCIIFHPRDKTFHTHTSPEVVRADRLDLYPSIVPRSQTKH